MEDYIKRLRLCGYSEPHAHAICHDFIREYNLNALIELIESLEKDRLENVD